MSPTPRAAAVLAAIALAALLVGPAIAAVAALALVVAVALDARAVRRRPDVERHHPRVLARGVTSELAVRADAPGARRVRLRQAMPPDLALDPREADGNLTGELLPRRRGRHLLPAVATRSEGPLGLAWWYHRALEDEEVLVYPDLPAARRLALAVRQGRLGGEGLRGRGPLGLGTDFESIRDYLPDDDVRQVNWRASARLGRPMSNQYRIEQDRDVVCVLDTGRLTVAPTAPAPGAPADRTRLDATLDAAAAVALVADEVGDRCGGVAFDEEVRAFVRPRRAGGDRVVRALFDLEPRSVDSDYELAFRAVEGAKRAFVLVLTDLLEEAAARPLVEAVPVLERRHAVLVASVSDPDLELLTSTPPRGPRDVLAAGVALDVLAARSRVAANLRRAGAQVLEAPPDRLASACVRAYLTAKARARV